MDSGASAAGNMCKDSSDCKQDEHTVPIPTGVGTTVVEEEDEDVPPPTAKVMAMGMAKLQEEEDDDDDEPTDCLVPITPDTVKEHGDFLIDLIQSPLTVVRQQLKLTSIDSEPNVTTSANIAFVDHGSRSPQTPKDGVFDPFAPGPDNMACAPRGKKYLDEFWISVTRRLDFDPSFDAFHDADSLSDQDMIESVYKNLLQVIISKQTEGVLAQISNVEYDSDNCKTPPSPLQSTAISDTCPGAPVKVKPGGGKPRNILVGLCKKLEF